MSGLTIIGQDDFGVGVLRTVAPDTQPGVGLYDVINGFINDDGDVYRRSGDVYVSSAHAQPVTFIWSGVVGVDATGSAIPGVVVATPEHTYSQLDPDAAHIIGPGIPAPVNPAIVRNVFYLPNGQKWTGVGAMTAWTRPSPLPTTGELHLCAAAGRLLVACANRIAFSTAPPDAFAFNATDFHELPGGVTVMGMAAIRDTVFVFTDYGLWTITNLAYDLTDPQGNPQQTLQLITPEIALWHESGLCEWEGRIVAPCTDRVYLIDGVGSPQAVSDSLGAFYPALVHQGYRPGGAKVFNQHLLLPVIDSDLNVQELLACRLSRPARGRYLYFPWSRLTGHAATAVAFDISTRSDTLSSSQGEPSLWAGGSDGIVTDWTGVLAPDAAPLDGDGNAYDFVIETRDFPTGNGQPNHIRQIRMRYTFKGEGVSAQASYSTQPEGFAAPRPWVTLTNLTLPEPGSDPLLWRLEHAERARYVRLRIRVSGASDMLAVHRVDLGVRPATHNR